MPKIIFRKMTKEENIELIKWSFFENDKSFDAHEFTIQCFPKLKDIDINKDSKEEIYKKIEQVVSDEYDALESKIDDNVNKYNEIWSTYNDLYFKTLCDYLKIDWPKEKEIIDARIGFTYIFPRYLDTYGFSITIEMAECDVVKICAHETLHFAWFLKWKELYPDCPRKEYDSPYIPWKYSEMVVDPILNSKEFKNVFKNLFEEKAYDSFYDLTFNGENVMDKLKEIYEKNIEIEEKIILGFDYINNIEFNTKK